MRGGEGDEVARFNILLVESRIDKRRYPLRHASRATSPSGGGLE